MFASMYVNNISIFVSLLVLRCPQPSPVSHFCSMLVVSVSLFLGINSILIFVGRRLTAECEKLSTALLLSEASAGPDAQLLHDDWMICLRLNPFLIDSEMSESAILKLSFPSLKDQHRPLPPSPPSKSLWILDNLLAD
ncbi:hypothetical protein ILYODFUR_034812 [Ilyodon furcidens]|uniref:Uncharacterized protein n=1 Tax=Ilyodon furcidens TaxID=33524 RepID=A0ABV0TDL0_9TELE